MVWLPPPLLQPWPGRAGTRCAAGARAPPCTTSALRAAPAETAGKGAVQEGVGKGEVPFAMMAESYPKE